ncbi:MAG: molecular chaperone HtpG, partial [Gammaproteobacteria bacterium]|nr:molecular chaperone HtpG [Gammaproteobacteria bacterium]
RIKKTLENKVKDVRITHRLTASPACLVTDEHDMGRTLERILKASGQKVPGSKPILEINSDHPVVQRLKQETDEQRFSDWSHILFDQALLSEGGQLDDPAGFVHRLNDMFLLLSGDNN